MALSFEDSLKAAKAESEAAAAVAAMPAVADNTSVMTLDYGIALAADGDITAYAETEYDTEKYDSYSNHPQKLVDNKISTIDGDKNVKLADGQINLTQESNSQYIPFKMSRYYDGFDLSTATLSVYWVNQIGSGSAAAPVNVSYDDEYIYFAWLVDGNVTRYAGTVKFEIQAKGTIVSDKGLSYPYVWKSRHSELNVVQALEYNSVIEPDEGWQTDFFSQANTILDNAQTAALSAQTSALAASEAAKKATEEAEAAVDNAVSTLEGKVDAIVAEEVSTKMGEYAKLTDLPVNVSELENDSDYATKSEVESIIADAELDKYATVEYVGDVPSGLVDSEGNAIDSVVEYVDYKVDMVNVTEQLEDYATKDYVAGAIADQDITAKLGNYYTKDETYSKSEINTAIENVEVDLSGYATKTDLDGYATTASVNTLSASVNSLSSSVSTNTGGIQSLNSAVTSINDELSKIDKSARVTYDATYGDVEADDGSITEHIFTLWKTENGVREVQNRFPISGGGGGGSSFKTFGIKYAEGYGDKVTIAVGENAIIKYEFMAEDSVGVTSFTAVASWKVGNRIVATQEVQTGEREFDITKYVGVGDNKIALTITYNNIATAVREWTVSVIDVRIESNFNDAITYAYGSPVDFKFTPYGTVDKTIHFLLDGKEIDTKISSSGSSGLLDSYLIQPEQLKSHGSHLLEVYITAKIGDDIESNHILEDIIWYDETSDIPVIGSIYQNFTAKQYDTTNIEYNVYDPNTETPTVEIAVDGDIVSTLTLTEVTNIYSYKSNVAGEHIITITCGETVKTLVATIEEIDIVLPEVKVNPVFDFNPIGKSNNDNNRIWSDGDVSMSVSDNFDWINGGYQIDENGDKYFCIKAGTSAEINYKLFEDDAKKFGKEFKLVFKTTNVAKPDATFLSCMDNTTDSDHIGIQMDVHEAFIYTQAGKLHLPYSEEDIIEFEFNISPTQDGGIPMVMGYEDGVSTCPMVYDGSHGFTQNTPKVISLGSEDCDLHIYRFKVYNSSLSDKDILNNFIIDARNTDEMISRYNRNQIYDKNQNFDPDVLAEKCPWLRIIKIEAPHFTDGKKYPVNNTTIQYIYGNGDKTLDNWIATDCVHVGQGTSSDNYGAAGRNLDLVMKPHKDFNNSPVITLGDNTTVVDKVSLTRDSVPANYFNIKVNIASSENANNALLQRRYNEFNPYNRAFIRDSEDEISKIKDTMEFHNCVVFIRETDPDITTHTEFADDKWHFYAIGNIGDSKKTDKSRLTDPDDPYECIIEIMDVKLPLSDFPSDTMMNAMKYTVDKVTNEHIYTWAKNENLGILYEKINGEYVLTEDETVNLDKTYYVDILEHDDFSEDYTYGWRYIFEYDDDVEDAEAKNSEVFEYCKQKWIDLYRFVTTSTDDEFKQNFGNYFVLDSALYYYLFTTRYTMVDNRAKNSFWHYGKTGEVDSDGNPIRKWDLSFDYDNDTSLGINNYGAMVYRYGLEDTHVDEKGVEIFRESDSTFFCRLRDLFEDRLKAMYNTLETQKAWHAEGLINQFDEWQSEFPEELWRLDIERKYIRTYKSSHINGEGDSQFLVDMAHGKKKYQRRQYERNQEKYMASKYQSAVASSDENSIVIRCGSIPEGDLVVKPNYSLTLTPYAYMYLNVEYATGVVQVPVRELGVPITVPFSGNSTDIVKIYSASSIQSVGDLSPIYARTINASSASKLKELIIGNGTAGYENPYLTALTTGSNYLLEKLNIENVSGLDDKNRSLDLSVLNNLKELYAHGSNVNGVTFSDGGRIEIAELPSISSLTMKNLIYLTTLDVADFSNLTSLTVENCSTVDLVTMLESAPNINRVRITGVDWKLEDTSLLEKLYSLKGFDKDGFNTDHSVLSGYVYVPVIKESKLNAYNEVWSDLTIEAGQVTEQHEVTFVNDDGTVLEVQYVDNNMFAVDPVTREDNPIPVPTKESSVSTNYTFAGWDTNLSATRIGAPRTVRATYTETIREYTIKYVVDMDNRIDVKQETKAPYGSNVVYNGETPVYTKGETIDATHFYLFDRWDKSGIVDGDKTITAVFDDCPYGEGYFEGKELSDMRPVEVYALTRLVEMDVLSCDGESISGTNIQTGDDFSFEMGYDVDYKDIESYILIKDKTSFNGSNYLDFNGSTPMYKKNDLGELEEVYKEVKLFDEDRDFVLAIDYEVASGNQSGAVFMQCFQNSGSNGFKLSCDSSPSLSWGDSTVTPSSYGNREMLVLRHIAGDNNLYVYASNISSSATATYTINKSTSTQSDIATLVFGAAKNDAGRFSNYCIGNINWCKIWYMDLGVETCKRLVSWTHEKITLEVSGFYRYALFDDFTKESTMSLLAKNLLGCKKKYNNTDSVAGGWASSVLNNFLNTRFYDAIPSQIKAIMKKVSVRSQIGNTTSGTSESGCFVNIPSAYDVDSSQTEYKNELYDNNQTINYMISNDARIRKYDGGEVGDYWLRTPDNGYTRYPLHVNSDGIPDYSKPGSVYSFTAADTELGVLIEISL